MLYYYINNIIRLLILVCVCVCVCVCLCVCVCVCRARCRVGCVQGSVSLRGITSG